MHNSMRNYKIIIFDLDGTVTESRSLISEYIFSALLELDKKYNVGIISGAELSQMSKQIPGLINSGFFIMSQSGNVIIDPQGKESWNFQMTFEERTQALEHIKALKEKFPVKSYTSNEDTIEDRGAQITYCAIGCNTLFGEKIKFDPDGKIRKMWLENIPLKKRLIEARIAGTTSIDYTAINRNKGANIEKLMGIMNWKAEDCLYVGDALFIGGNDETVLGVCETKLVFGPEDILKITEELT